MAKVIVTGFIKISPENLDNVKAHLKKHIQLTRNESGCLTFNVTQRETDSPIFDVYEEFENKAAFFAHQERVKNSLWGKVTKNVTRDYAVTGLDCRKS